MKLPSFATLSALLLASEVALGVAKRSKSQATGKDRLTLPLLWTVIGLSIFAGLFLRVALPQGRLPHPQIVYVIGLSLFLLGLIIRWIAIIHLGRFFTVNATDHRAGICCMGIGAPAVVSVLELLVVLGVSRFISLGTAGESFLSGLRRARPNALREGSLRGAAVVVP